MKLKRDLLIPGVAADIKVKRIALLQSICIYPLVPGNKGNRGGLNNLPLCCSVYLPFLVSQISQQIRSVPANGYAIHGICISHRRHGIGTVKISKAVCPDQRTWKCKCYSSLGLNKMQLESYLLAACKGAHIKSKRITSCQYALINPAVLGGKMSTVQL